MTTVLALNAGHHDGAITFLDDGELVFSLEAEKDSFARHAPVTAASLFEALHAVPSWPDILALGGWHKVLPGHHSSIGAGYRGLEAAPPQETTLLGHPIVTYTSSHERSHLFCGVGLSPFDPSEPLAVLVWEGAIGAFYKWADRGRSIERIDALDQPGARYASLFGLADPTFADQGANLSPSFAGKLMAIAGLDDGRAPSDDTREVVQTLLSMPYLYPFDKARFRASILYNAGVEHPEVARAARLLSDQLFECFRAIAATHLPRGLPLVVTGGCGLNCDWNSEWERTGLFRSVFVPPCTNDSGSSIGTAVDAWVQAGGSGTVRWDVYRGAPFVDDVDPAAQGWTRQPIDAVALSRHMARGAVIAWARGRAEIGPRALGHRSLLASAELPANTARLNTIKQREAYRPVAPVCLEEDLGRWFDRDQPDPWMLRFRRVLQPEWIPAVTHADGSARVQSVTAANCPELHELLVAHRQVTGIGVLCNTSLNFPGKGFINRTSDLLHFAELNGLDDVVAGDFWYRKDRGSTPASTV